jgi:hypothetical protein
MTGNCACHQNQKPDQQQFQGSAPRLGLQHGSHGDQAQTDIVSLSEGMQSGIYIGKAQKTYSAGQKKRHSKQGQSETKIFGKLHHILSLSVRGRSPKAHNKGNNHNCGQQGEQQGYVQQSWHFHGLCQYDQDGDPGGTEELRCEHTVGRSWTPQDTNQAAD